MTFEKTPEKDLKETPMFLYGNHYLTLKNDLPYYVYHKLNETWRSNPFSDGLLTGTTFVLGKLGCSQ